MATKFDKFLGKIREQDAGGGGASGVQTVNLVGPNDAGNVSLTAANISTSDGPSIEEVLGMNTPVGTVIAFAGNSAPDGFIVCNGALIDRTTYADLFAAIGTLYGEGDGSTTFALPDLTNRFIQGSSTAGTSKGAGLPNITGATASASGNYGVMVQTGFSGSGAFYGNSQQFAAWLVPGGDRQGLSSLSFDASRSNPIYGNSTTVQPPALTMLYCIKY